MSRTVTGIPSRLRGGESSSTAPSIGGAGDDGLIDRARANPQLAIAIVGGGLLLIAWIAWAIYTTSQNGATAGLGVVLSWPVLLGALILVALPFYGIFLLVRRIREDDLELGDSTTSDEAVDEAEEEDDEEEAEAEDDEDEDEDDEDEDTSAEAGDDEDEDDDEADAEAEKSSKKAGSSAGS